MKPTEVFGRESEWQALERFATGSEPAGGLAVVYGRRRQGKSFLLRRLASVFGGLYFQATTSPRALALADLGGAVAAHRGIAGDELRLDS